MVSVDVLLVELLTNEFMVIRYQIIADIFLDGQNACRPFYSTQNI